MDDIKDQDTLMDVMVQHSGYEYPEIEKTYIENLDYLMIFPYQLNLFQICWNTGEPYALE